MEMGPVFVFSASEGDGPAFLGFDHSKGTYFLQHTLEGKMLYVPPRAVVFYSKDREAVEILAEEWDPRCSEDYTFRLNYVRKLLMEKKPKLFKE